MTEPQINHAIEALAEVIKQTSTAIVNLHATATADPYYIEYARLDLADAQRALTQALDHLGMNA